MAKNWRTSLLGFITIVVIVLKSVITKDFDSEDVTSIILGAAAIAAKDGIGEKKEDNKKEN